MPVSGVLRRAQTLPGLALHSPQCKLLSLHYCDHYASSSGLNSLLSHPNLLPSLTKSHPATEFRISPRPNHHPVLKAHYINGRIKAVCVKNLQPTQILKKTEMLLASDGAKAKKLGSKKVLSTNENVRGVWSPMHGGIKSI